MISYVDDKNMLALCMKDRDWSLVNDLRHSCLCEHQAGVSYYGITVKEIQPLVRVYGEPFYSISFLLKNISREYSIDDVRILDDLLTSLFHHMNANPGYYIVKIPTHVVSLLDSLNRKPAMKFAGGTVCYMHNGKAPEAAAASIEVRIMDKDDLRFNQAEMIDLGIDGFKDYFGQYHIGEYTRPKAGIIYANWVKEYVQGGRGITYGAFADGKLAGFLNCDEGNGVLELVLSAVSQAVRGRGVYESMIRASVSDAARHGAIITTSTQFDNFSVQRAWVNIGFKPYYSFYLNHFNSL